MVRSCSTSGQSVTCALGTIGVSGDVTVRIGTVVKSNTPPGSIVNTAKASTTTNDVNQTNNTDEA